MHTSAIQRHIVHSHTWKHIMQKRQPKPSGSQLKHAAMTALQPIPLHPIPQHHPRNTQKRGCLNLVPLCTP